MGFRVLVREWGPGLGSRAATAGSGLELRPHEALPLLDPGKAPEAEGGRLAPPPPMGGRGPHPPSAVQGHPQWHAAGSRVVATLDTGAHPSSRHGSGGGQSSPRPLPSREPLPIGPSLGPSDHLVTIQETAGCPSGAYKAFCTPTLTVTHRGDRARGDRGGPRRGALSWHGCCPELPKAGAGSAGTQACRPGRGWQATWPNPLLRSAPGGAAHTGGGGLGLSTAPASRPH